MLLDSYLLFHFIPHSAIASQTAFEAGIVSVQVGGEGLFIYVQSTSILP